MFEVACIAMAIYFEARSEPLDGQVAVANTIMNRVASPRFPDTPCEVVQTRPVMEGGTCSVISAISAITATVSPK